MKLHSTITSAFARKVWVVAHETGLSGRIERIATNPHIDEYLREDNPLCRIPTLVLDDGDVLFDSPVICEYLDSLHSGPKLFPPTGVERWFALRLQALGDGIVDTNIARRDELARPTAEQRQDLVEHRRRGVDAGYAWLDARITEIGLAPLTIGQVAIGCALGWSLIAFPEDPWRKNHPRLAAWHADFEKRPSMAATRYDTLKRTLPAAQIKAGPAATPLAELSQRRAHG
ncbi:MAG: glutathione S-transferase family protein [Pseudorhodoplanes sp.]|uniref:glutathione S-transferase family protein n=1 Tax=Pseudorhodoplanes sp. TaxID=1934341 RepID=UPI003D1227CF